MVKTDVNVRTSYKTYKSECETPVDLILYCKIVNLFMKFIMNKVFEGYEVVLPHRMGTILIKGTKIVNPRNKDGKMNYSPNWKKTKELRDKDPVAKEQRKIVYCLNEHTGGVIYKLDWSKFTIPIINKTIYYFRGTRENKRKVNHMIVEKGMEYIIVKEK